MFDLALHQDNPYVLMLISAYDDALCDERMLRDMRNMIHSDNDVPLPENILAVEFVVSTLIDVLHKKINKEIMNNPPF